MITHRFWLAAFAALLPGLSFAQFGNFPKASVVLGQTSFTSRTSNTTARALNGPSSVAIDPTTGKVFVADTSNHRVLRYANINTLGTGAPAEAVFGQAGVALGLPNRGGLPNAGTLFSPSGVHVDSAGFLWVADTGNNRVLGFADAATASSGSTAVLAFGQPNFSTNTAAIPPTANSLNQPAMAWTGPGNRLWIADTENHRILGFDNLSELITVQFNGAPANRVLGQTSFTSATVQANRFGFNRPAGIALDGTGRLWVADSAHNRVLRFDDAAALPNGAAATRVLGQRNFKTFVAARGANGLRNPNALFVDAVGSLWVADRGNDRVLRFDRAAALPNNAPAEAVIGQPDFETTRRGVSNREVRIGRGGMAIDDVNRLWLSDDGNNRVLRFTPLPLLETRSGDTIRTSRRRVRISGKASDASGIATVRFKVGNIPFKTARGKNRWFFRAPVEPGTTVIKVIAISKLGQRSDALRIKVVRD